MQNAEKKVIAQVKELSVNFAGKHILITGANGLIGSSLVDILMLANDYLENKITVFALGRERERLEKRFASYLYFDELRIVEGDVTSIAFSEDFALDYIIHAASPAHPLAFSTTPVEVMKANLVGTIHMLDLAMENRAKILFVSSGEIYGISDEAEKCFSENDSGYVDILSPRSCYPESKRAAETLCASYHAQYGVDCVIARLCHVFGASITERNSRADAQFLRNALHGEDIVMKSPGTQVRSYCYVKDAVCGLLFLLAKGKGGEAYNVANKNSVASIREYAQTLAEISGVSIVNGFPTEQESSGYSVVSRAVLNAEKLERLGWRAAYGLKEGLEETYEYGR